MLLQEYFVVIQQQVILKAEAHYPRSQSIRIGMVMHGRCLKDVKEAEVLVVMTKLESTEQ